MILETKNLTKRFGSMYALQHIDFSLEKGEIHGLVGENGAGKSTLIKIITGVYHPSEGEIIFDGRKVEITRPSEGRKLGINVIHQDRNLVPSFNGIENIFLGLPSEKKHFCTVDFKAMRERVAAVMAEYEIDVPLDKMASELTPPQKTLLEIVRSMMTECKLLILDEPTASLTDKESEVLFKIIRKVNAKGTAILYISHRLDEIFALTDRITVFKNGELVETVRTKEINQDGLVGLMTDNWVSEQKETIATAFSEIAYSVEHVSTTDLVVKDATFSVRKGEILGIFGLGGSGRTELLEALYGYKSIKEGIVRLNGKQLGTMTPAFSIKQGIVLINEDRRGCSLVESRSVKDNIVLSTIASYSKKGKFDSKSEKQDARDKIAELKIKTTGINQPVWELSGGNQQKVVFAKALMSHPQVFLCDEPTQAVDIKTRFEIHELLRQRAREGSSVVYVTSDLKEMLMVADTIIIMANGRTWEQIPNISVSSEQILTYCYQQR
ncbi:ABC-type sugar transport system, ATPase component [Sphaerochaeta pleomorpha str. Grapes]|uniref:ABC-type sugar transport system, ATPase component n=1 Tax=Sphaerochaeta pleomorpha (strain ATCC BAA-1885 / DSM 22778 / Grapes) TaxID=158190 RepID=G8QQL7_SPHPG|nr:sugar ABC transporter ATP-binding protein [Sphaerochaeta pleomorpha]AEV30947.1 ABC-type sugar transport system, ATPase component [Sphaerochaeta pleomorpha str. Grapes]